MCVVFVPFWSIAGRHSVPEEGGMEVPPGLLPVEQHGEGKRGHSAVQNVSVVGTEQQLFSMVQ